MSSKARVNNSPEVDLARHFFDELYGDLIGPEACMVMWSPAKGVDTTWATSTAQAASTAIDRSLKLDSYFQPCLHSKDLVIEVVDKIIASGERTPRAIGAHRGFHESAVVMPGVWADIDTQQGSHQNPEGMPPTTRGAIMALAGGGAQPSLIVDTGGGVHAYWLFDEPMLLESDEQRDAMRDLNYRWQQGYVRGLLEAEGWTKLDSTHDLTRVLRVPGTKNRKYAPPREVDWPTGDVVRRYTTDDLEMYVPNDIGAAPSRMKRKMGLGKIPSGEKPPSVIGLMIDMNPSFGEVWHRRRDFKSQSEYDLSIASHMFAIDARVEDVLDAICAHRKLGGGDPAEKHPSYYERTLGLASEKSESQVQVEEIVEEIHESQHQIQSDTQDGADKRASILAKIGKLMGLRDGMSILAIECTSSGESSSKGSVYTLSTSHGRVSLGTMKQLDSYKNFRAALMEVFRVVPNDMSKKWKTIMQMLLTLIEEVDLGHDATENGQTQSLLMRWVEEGAVASGLRESNKRAALGKGRPFFENGKCYIAPAYAVNLIARYLPSGMLTVRELTERLLSFGASIHSHSSIPSDELPTTRQKYDIWVLPYTADFWLRTTSE